MRVVRTKVVIIGAGPAGLALAHLLGLEGVETIVLERRDREYVERRVRAGLLEPGTVELLRELGVAGRLEREAAVHDGFELCFDGARHRVCTLDLAGYPVHMYGQQEVVKDLIQARIEAGSPPRFGVEDVAFADITGDSAVVRCTLDGEPVEIHADFAAGCDGFHGVSRQAIPGAALRTYEHAFPFGWLGILAEARPVGEELVYNTHERGFTLHSMRTVRLSRQYLQVGPDADLADWPDQRIWDELRTRLVGADERLTEGPVLEKSITSMRAMVCEPMQYGRLLLAGDAAHIVPPSAAKGLNLAVADARALAEALVLWFAKGNREALDDYSRSRLPDVWQAQEFSAWMTHLLHRYPGESEFEDGLRRARLRSLVTENADAVGFAGKYVGLSRLRSFRP